MDARETYQERISRQIAENLTAELENETVLEKAYRTAISPKEKATLVAKLEPVWRMQRMDRCFKTAVKKIKNGKKLESLHRHEVEALHDSAEFDGVTLEKLLESL